MAEPVLVGIGKGGQRLMLNPTERSTHMHVIGASGRGKSKFLENLIRQDIEKRHGLCLIDPHGTLYDEIVAWSASLRLADRRRIHLIDPNDTDWTIGFDPFRCDITDPDLLSVTVDGAVEACAQVWGGEDTNKTPMLKKCLRAVFYALAATGRPFSDALALTATRDPERFRDKVTESLDDPEFRRLWDDFRALEKRQFTETFSSTVNRLAEFLTSPTIRRMLSQKENTLDLRRCMEEGDIILVNLKTRKLSSSNARLIGTLLTNALFKTAVQRNEKDAKRRPFYLYIDECYQYLTSDVEAMLDQTRKFGLHVILAHQHLEQLRKYGDHVFNAVMTNAQTRVIFGGLSDTDAEFMAKESLRETFDYNVSKAILEKPTVVGYERIWMRNRSQSYSASETEGSNTSESQASSTSSSRTTSQSYDPWGLPMPGSSQSVAVGHVNGGNTGRGTSYAKAKGYSESEGESEALFPIFEILPSAVEGQEEIMNRAILRLRKLNQGLFILTRPYADPVLTSAPRIDSLAIRPDRVEAFKTAVLSKSPFIVRREVADAEPEPVVEEDDPFSVPEG